MTLRLFYVCKNGTKLETADRHIETNHIMIDNETIFKEIKDYEDSYEKRVIHYDLLR